MNSSTLLVRTCLVRAVISLGLWSSVFVTPAAASNEWAPLFTAPFVAQTVNTLDGSTPAPAPETYGATLSTVVGLSVGQTIVVDVETTPGMAMPMLTKVVSIGDPTLGSNWVEWAPSLPVRPVVNGLVRAGLFNGSVATVFALQYPKQSAVDASGRIYTVDSFNDRVVASENTGRPLWTLGDHAKIYSDDQLPEEDRTGNCDNTPVAACPNDPGTRLGGLFTPYGIDVSDDGRTLVVSDTNNHRIEIFTQVNSGGTVSATTADGSIGAPAFRVAEIGGIGTGVGQFNAPAGVSLDARGRIAVADEYNHRIQIFAPLAAGASAPAGTTVVTASDGGRYSAFAFGQFGSPDVVDPNDIRFFDPEDVEFDRSVNADGSASATNGRIVVADADNNRVQVFDTSGAFLSVIGSDVAASSNPGDFDAPLGVTVDPTGRMYVVDTHNSRIQVFAPAGATYALEETFGAEQTAGVPGLLPLLGPTGIAARGGRLIITEQAGNRIQVLARAVMNIDGLTTTPSAPEALIITDHAKDHIHVGVTVRNTGPVALTDVSLVAVASHLGTFISSPTPASVDLAPGRAALFEFDYQVTGLGGGLQSLRFNVSTTGNASGVRTSASATLDTQVTVQPPDQAAIVLGQLGASPDRVGANDQIRITVPVQNIGGAALSNIAIAVTASSGPGPATLVAPSNASMTIPALAPHATSNLEFIFTSRQAGSVTFTASVVPQAGEPSALYEHPPASSAVTVHISDDAVAPQVVAWTTPTAVALSGDGKRWYNASTGWPTVTVMARDNVSIKKLGWYMVNTSGQAQSDQVGYCSAREASISPNPCIVGPDGTLIWRRTLTDMHRRIVIAFWAEDTNGNGAATVSDLVACNQIAESEVVLMLGPVTCVSLHVDIDPPVIYEGRIEFSADNTEARVPFTTGDVNSGVKRVAWPALVPPDAMNAHGPMGGELILRSEGTAVTGQIVVTDNADNTVTRRLPYAGTLRLDRTPPEAFNRLDVSGLSRPCTTAIDGKATNYFCGNKVYGTDNLPGLTTAAFAPVRVQQVKWNDTDQDDDKHDWDGAPAELHTYSFTDAYVPASGDAPAQNPNQVTLVEKVRQAADEARVRVVSYQYRRGTTLQQAIAPDWATKEYEWSLSANGSLQSLTQTFVLHKNRDRIKVQASFDAKSGVTTIKSQGTDAKRLVAQGLILLRMTTANGDLVIDYDLNAPVTK